MSAQTAAPAARSAVTVDAGVSQTRYTDSTTVRAASAGIGWQRMGMRTEWLASASASSGGGLWSAYGTLAGTRTIAITGPLFADVAASGSSSLFPGGTLTSDLDAQLRLHLARETIGMWIGGSAGTAYNGDGWRAIRSGDISAWTQRGAASALVSFVSSHVGREIAYRDLEGSAASTYGPVELSFALAHRFASRDARELVLPAGESRTWARGAVVWWYVPRVGLSASGGVYPYDPGQSTPGGRYLALGVRLKAWPRNPMMASLDSLWASTPSAATPRDVVLIERGAGEWLLRVRADTGATRVEVMGDFTNWTPRALQRSAESGWWDVRLPLAKGVRYLNVRVDGGAWYVPAGLPVVTDDFNGQVGVLVVP